MTDRRTAKPGPAILISTMVIRFPAAFVAQRWQQQKPLKIGIAADLTLAAS
jgi:sRNA-binding protein